MTAARLRLVARMGGSSSRLAPFVIGSFALHLGLVAAMLWWPSSRGPSRIRADAIAVTLTGGFPSARTQPRRQAAPAPKPEPPKPEPPKPKPEGASLETNPVKVDPTPKKKKEPEPTPKPQDAPAETPVAPVEDAAEGGGVQGPEGGGDEGVVGVAGGAIASLNLADVGLSWYAGSVTAALRSHYNPPMLVGTRETLVVVVFFEIRRDGSVARLQVESSSGVPSMDRAALRAVADAQPLPSLPAEVSGPVLPARFEFRWHPGES